MKSLKYIKGFIEQQLAFKNDKLYDINEQLEKIEGILEYLNDPSKPSEFKYVDKDESLSSYESYLSLRHQELEEDLTQLERDSSFIIYNKASGDFYINSKYSYEDLYSFINRYLSYFSSEDLMEIFLTVKQIKMNQIVEQAEKSIEQSEKTTPQEIEIQQIREQAKNAMSQQSETSTELDTTDSELVSDLSNCISEEEPPEIEKREEKITEIDNNKKKIMYFYHIAAKELVANNKLEENINEFSEKGYQLITNARAKCQDFQKSDLYKFFNDMKNRNTFYHYRETSDIKSLDAWIRSVLPEYHDCVRFDFFDRVINNVDICNKFLMAYQDIIESEKIEDLDDDDCYKYIITMYPINDLDLISKINFDFVKNHAFDDETVDVVYEERKNIIFYTPESVKNTPDEKLLEPMKKMVNSFSQCSFEQIISKYRPSHITSCDSAQNDAVPISKYIDGLAWEYRLEGTIRAICSRDSIIQENKQRLMDHYKVRDMEIMSIHNIFDSNHGGTDNGSLSIGQYGYTPYCNQIEFYEILTKEEVWTDEEFDYVCMVADFCSNITESIIKSNNKSSSKKSIKELSNELKIVLMNHTQLNEIGGNKNGR